MAFRRWHVLADLVEQNGYALGAEIGCLKGRNLKQLLDRCPDLRMYAVERDVTPELAGIVGRLQARVTLLRGESTEIAERIPLRALDFVFIDAEHSYEAVAHDIAAWLPKIRPGGALTGHDYANPRWPDVKPAVDENAPGLVETFDDYVWVSRIA